MTCPACGATILAIDATVDPRLMALRFVAQCGHEQDVALTRALWEGGMRWSLPVVDGAALATAERHRQVHEEGFTAERDAMLGPNDLTWAAWCLLDAAASGSDPETQAVPQMWPNDVAGEWKPDQSPNRRLVIAAALILAEIDRRLIEQRRGQ